MSDKWLSAYFDKLAMSHKKEAYDLYFIKSLKDEKFTNISPVFLQNEFENIVKSRRIKEMFKLDDNDGDSLLIIISTDPNNPNSTLAELSGTINLSNGMQVHASRIKDCIKSFGIVKSREFKNVQEASNEIEDVKRTQNIVQIQALTYKENSDLKSYFVGFSEEKPDEDVNWFINIGFEKCRVESLPEEIDSVEENPDKREHSTVIIEGRELYDNFCDQNSVLRNGIANHIMNRFDYSWVVIIHLLPMIKENFEKSVEMKICTEKGKEQSEQCQNYKGTNGFQASHVVRAHLCKKLKKSYKEIFNVLEGIFAVTEIMPTNVNLSAGKKIDEEVTKQLIKSKFDKNDNEFDFKTYKENFLDCLTKSINNNKLFISKNENESEKQKNVSLKVKIVKALKEAKGNIEKYDINNTDTQVKFESIKDKLYKVFVKYYIQQLTKSAKEKMCENIDESLENTINQSLNEENEETLKEILMEIQKKLANDIEICHESFVDNVTIFNKGFNLLNNNLDDEP